MKLLTIFTAAYNVEEHIDKILNSFLRNKYRDLLDIIVVNDRSTDRTQKIVEEIAHRYSHVITVANKENFRSSGDIAQ